jgi:hypothetical protein
VGQISSGNFNGDVQVQAGMATGNVIVTNTGTSAQVLKLNRVDHAAMQLTGNDVFAANP